MRDFFTQAMQPCRSSRHLTSKGRGLHLDIIEGLKARDEAALRRLMEDYGDMLLRTAYLLLGDRQAAEEAVQDTFLQAYAKIGQLKDPLRLKAWLVSIAVNRCRMRRRTWSWRSIFPAGASNHWLPDKAGSADSAEALALAGWNQHRISDAIIGLDYIYRECLTLYYYHEMSVLDIAGQLGKPENTVKSRLARGRRLLKQVLEKEGIRE